MPQPTLLALDPGGTTGYTFCRNGEWLGGELGPQEHHEDLWNMLHNLRPPDHIICERFDYEIRRDSKNEFDVPGINLISRNYIGIVELYCKLTNIKLYMQPRHVLTLAWTADASLKKMGLYVPGKQHQNDATRHMLYHLAQTVGDKRIFEKLRKL